jgi:hypothetical protein
MQEQRDMGATKTKAVCYKLFISSHKTFQVSTQVAVGIDIPQQEGIIKLINKLTRIRK